MRWNIKYASKIGGRTLQQDRIKIRSSKDKSTHLIVLTDGLGGHMHAELATDQIIQTASAYFKEIENNLDNDYEAILHQICMEAHNTLTQENSNIDNPPATTCLLLLLRNDKAYWVHIGDTRLYHFRHGKFCYKTNDHSMAQLSTEQLSAEQLPPMNTDQQTNSNSNELFMCIGGKNDIHPEVESCIVDQNDCFVLCTDGLWENLEIEQTAQILKNHRHLQQAADFMTNLAVDLGGDHSDNASVILVKPKSSIKELFSCY